MESDIPSKGELDTNEKTTLIVISNHVSRRPDF